MDIFQSDNFENLLLAMDKCEIRDFVGVKIELAESLIKCINEMKAMLEWEIKSRTINKFSPPATHSMDGGAWPNG